VTTSDLAKASLSLEGQVSQSADLVERMKTTLHASRSVTIPGIIYEGVEQLSQRLPIIRKQLRAFEDEMVRLQALESIGGIVNSSLELDYVLQIVMDSMIQITGAERAFLMLRDERGELSMRTARNWERETLEPDEFAISTTILNRVAATGRPVLTTNASEDPRFIGQESIVVNNLRSILCVPMFVKDQLVGVIYADNRIRSGLFTQKELSLLAAFSNQAAVAIENARLFESVRNTLSEVTRLKNLMDNVFSSIASGVLTSDVEDRILLCNQAAELILGRSAEELVGSTISVSLQPLAAELSPHLANVLSTDQPVMDLELSPTLGERGRVDLHFNLSPLKNNLQATQGVAIVVEDLTEKKRLEGQRRLFERMVSPKVIEQLSPDQMALGGHRTEISVLFADLRGFSSFSESVQPEELVAVLNRYLAMAADAILDEEGTIDKFLGDAVMAWFNAPIPQEDHALRAVRTALAIQGALPDVVRSLPRHQALSFGIGIHIGDAVLGLIGTEKRLEYTAIGDSVNTARRIQENAAAGQVLISQPVLDRLKDKIIFEPVEPIQAKGKREPIVVYNVLGLC